MLQFRKCEAVSCAHCTQRHLKGCAHCSQCHLKGCVHCSQCRLKGCAHCFQRRLKGISCRGFPSDSWQPSYDAQAKLLVSWAFLQLSAVLFWRRTRVRLHCCLIFSSPVSAPVEVTMPAMSATVMFSSQKQIKTGTAYSLMTGVLMSLRRLLFLVRLLNSTSEPLMTAALSSCHITSSPTTKMKQITSADGVESGRTNEAC